MKHSHIVSLAMACVISSTNAMALDADECFITAEIAEYVAVQRDAGTPDLVVVFNARNRFDIVNEPALMNMIQSVYAVPHLLPNDIYRHTLRGCFELLNEQRESTAL